MITGKNLIIIYRNDTQEKFRVPDGFFLSSQPGQNLCTYTTRGEQLNVPWELIRRVMIDKDQQRDGD